MNDVRCVQDCRARKGMTHSLRTRPPWNAANSTISPKLMTAYYENLMGYPSAEENKALLRNINASQKENESRFPRDVSAFRVSGEAMDKIADLIGGNIIPPQN